MPDFGVDQARQRVLDALHSGRWESVDAQLSAYGAAVRADERHRVLSEALAALQDCIDRETGCSAADCLAVVRHLL